MSAGNYSTIQDYINTAPNCAVPCLQDFWGPYITSCGSSRNWPCLCASGPGASTTNQQQQLADSPTCVIPFCSSMDMNNAINARHSLAAFCGNYPLPANSSSVSISSSLVLTSTVLHNTTTSTMTGTTTSAYTTPTTSFSNSTTSTTTRTSSRSSTISSRSSSSSSSRSSSSSSTASSTTTNGPVKTNDPRITNPILAGASGFSPSTALVVLGSLWACLTVLAQI